MGKGAYLSSLYSGSSSSSNSPGHPSNSNYNHGTGQSGGQSSSGSWSPSNVPDWRKPKDKKPFVAGSSGVNVTTQTQQEIDEAKEIQHYQNWLGSTAHQGAGAGNVTWKDILKEREEAAYQAAKNKQNQMQEAIDLLYTGNPEINAQTGEPITDEEKLQWMEETGKPWTSTSWIDRATSNFHYLTDSQKQQIIDSGLAAAESEGILGGTMGAELVMNDLKKQLQNATSNEEYQAALNSLNSLLGNKTGWMYDDISNYDPESQYVKDWKAKMQSLGLYDPKSGSALGYDQSAVYSWGDVESNPFLYKAHQELGSKNLTPSKYTDYMDKISAFGHMGTAPGGTGGGWGSGWGSGGGGGGSGGGSGFGLQTHDPMQQGYQRGQVGPGTLQEQVNQIYLGMGNLNAAPGFNKNRGGIVSLVQ